MLPIPSSTRCLRVGCPRQDSFAHNLARWEKVSHYLSRTTSFKKYLENLYSFKSAFPWPFSSPGWKQEEVWMSCQRKDILMLHLFRGEHPVCPISQVSQSPRHIYGLLGPSGRCTCELRAVSEKSLPSFLRYSSRNRSVCLLPRKNNLPLAM